MVTTEDGICKQDSNGSILENKANVTSVTDENRKNSLEGTLNLDDIQEKSYSQLESADGSSLNMPRLDGEQKKFTGIFTYTNYTDYQTLKIWQ